MYNHYYFNTQSFTHLSVQETRETREKTRTQIFRAGSGQVSIKKIFRFLVPCLRKTRKFRAGQVSNFFRFLDTCGRGTAVDSPKPEKPEKYVFPLVFKFHGIQKTEKPKRTVVPKIFQGLGKSWAGVRP